jgi:predicted acyl esterase
MLKALLTAGGLLLSSALANAYGERTWSEYVEMEDGVKLHTRITVPRGFEDGTKLTAIMDRSPYGQFGIELIDDLFVPAGFITVCQDMRGTGLSGGRFSNWKADANDSLVTGNWVIAQNWSNTEIYLFGASADGLGGFTTNYNSPTWLQSQYYIWTSSIGYEVIYPNGALLFNLLDRWIGGTVRDYDVDKCYGEFMENEAQTSWWDDLTFTGNYQLVTRGQFGFWAGWYDIFLVGNLAAYHGFNYESDPAVRGNSVLLIDPCGHCQDAAPYFTEDVIAGRTALGLMQAYATFGSRPVARTNIKNVTFYVMSSNDAAGVEAGQFWTSVEAFPVPVMTKYYLHGDGSVSTAAPSASDGLAESTSYVSDPLNPIGTNGGNNLWSDAPCGPLDQAEIDTRADVIVFQTPVFEEELALTGAINGHLYVSSDAIDTDIMVRVSDVYPTGEARLIQDSAARMRWREGGLEPVYMQAGQVYPASISLWNTSYVVAPGHALRFSLSSSNFPRFSVNYNNGVLLADPASPGEPVTATNVIYHSETYPTYIELPVIDKSVLPQINNIKGEFQKAYPTIDYDAAMEKGPALLEKLASIGRMGAK